MVVAGGMVIAAGPAAAAPSDWYVSTIGSNADDCATAATACATIRHVLDDLAASGDTVHLAAGTYGEAEITVDHSVTITGPKHGTATVSASGEGIFGAFGDNVPDPVTVTFKNLDISGDADGEGVLVESAAVNFVNVHVDGNGNGGVVGFDAKIVATHSTFSGNSAAGISLSHGIVRIDHTTVNHNHGAGLLVTTASMRPNSTGRPSVASGLLNSVRVDHSTVSNNKLGGVRATSAATKVLSSTLSGNTGLGLANDSGVALVRNSTITYTQPWPGGDGDPSGGIVSSDTQNVVGPARSIASVPDLDPGQVAVTGSIVAHQNPDVPDCDGTLVDDGYNLSSDAANSCGLHAAKHDVIKKNPRLGPLADHGGATATRLPQEGSPAIDVIPAGHAGCAKSATDQRDKPRLRPVGGKCDIGAVELAARPLVIHPKSLPNGTVGKKYAETITATGGQFPSYTFAVTKGRLPRGLNLSVHGRLSGTPTRADTYTFTVRATEGALHVTKGYEVRISAG